MSLTRANVIILAIAISFLCVNATLIKGAPFFKFAKYYVIVSNRMQASGDQLGVHCKSKDDDLGFHNLMVGEQYQWNFRVNYGQSTLFTCTLSWIGGSKAFVAFEVEDTFFIDRCGGRHCTWKAQEDGIYLFDIQANKFNFVYKWDKAIN